MKKLRFINVVPLFLDDVPAMAEQARRIYQEVGLTEVALSLSLHPEGETAQVKAKCMLEAFAKLRGALHDTPQIKLGILIQSTIGHGWSGSIPLSGESWQRIVHESGETGSRHCPLDKNFRAYIINAIKQLTVFHPAFFLVDDDFGVRPDECYCPLHLAELKKRSGREFTAAELIDYVKTHQPGDVIFDTFEQIRYDMQIEFANEIRQAIDSVDNSIPCGMCCPWAGHHYLQDIALALAGNTEPFIRLANAIYGNKTPEGIFDMNRVTAIRKHYCPEVGDFIAESDTFPQNLYSMSANQMHIHILCNILNGLNGSKLWITDFSDNHPEQGAGFERILSRNMNFYQVLLQELEWYEFQGVVTPLPDFKREKYNFTDPCKILYSNDLIADCFARFGVPGYYIGNLSAGAKRIFGLTADLVKFFTDDELKEIFSGRVIVDGAAAEAVTRRGLAEYLGCQVIPGESDFFFKCEIDLADNGRIGTMYDSTIRRLKLTGGAALSQFCNEEFRRSGDLTPVAPGVVKFTNSLGGHVVTLAWDCSLAWYKKYLPSRKRLLMRALNFLMGGMQFPVALAEQQILVYYGENDRSGHRLLAAVNLSFDPLTTLDFRVDENLTINLLLELKSDGQWVECDFALAGNTLTICRELGCFEAAVFRF